MNRRWRRLLRVVGSIVLLAIVIAFLPAGTLQSALAQSSPSVLAASLGLFLLCHVAAAFKWRMLMGRDVDLPFIKALQAHFTGLVGNLSPLGMIGGDVVRAGVAINGSGRAGAVVVTSVVDRMVDTAALLLLTCAGVMWIGSRSTMVEAVLWGGGVLTIAGAAGTIAALSALKRSGNPRLAGVRDAVQVLAERPALIARALTLSVLIQGMLIATNAYIGHNVGVDISFAAWLVAWPAAKLAAYIPIGIAGIGIRESALVALLRPLGGGPGPVMASSLLWDAVIIVGALVGWLILCVLPHLRPMRLRRLSAP
jgi:uncharacterized membrane protein YbhN (UPF0104 family)